MDNTVGSQQSNIVIGTLLGDGFLERNGKHPRLVFDHSVGQEPYARWKSSYLDDFNPTVVIKQRCDSRTGRTYHHCIVRTRTSRDLEDYYSLFHKERRKVLPEKLPQIINAQILAVWIMDDGYKRNDCNAMRLNTQSYSLNEHEIICVSLQRLGVEVHVQKHAESFVTYIPSASMRKVCDLVRPFMTREMMYKIV